MFDYNDYGDYYDDYNEFNAQVEEFKQSLIRGVKEEHQRAIEKLRKENAELQETKRNWSNLEREYKNKIREIENEKEDVIKNTKREIYQDKLKDFLEKAFETRELFEVNTKWEESDKCNICDPNRQIILKDNLDREYKVNCKCKDSKKHYMVEESSTLLYIQKAERENNFWMSLRVSDGSYSSTPIFGFGDIELESKGKIFNKFDKNLESKGKIFNKFDKNNLPSNNYYTYFTNKEEAQKYADYLNETEKEAEKTIPKII